MRERFLTKLAMEIATFREYLKDFGWQDRGPVLLSPNGHSECHVHRTYLYRDGMPHVCWEIRPLGGEDEESAEEIHAFVPSWIEGEPEWADAI